MMSTKNSTPKSTTDHMIATKKEQKTKVQGFPFDQEAQ